MLNDINSPAPCFFFFFSFLTQPVEVLPAAGSTQILALIAALHLAGDPALLGCPPAAKGLFSCSKQSAEQLRWDGGPWSFPLLEEL